MPYKPALDWNQTKVVIFDVDGTLYTQSKLRKKMLFSLLAYYALRPWRAKEMLMLQHFRQEREKRPGDTGPDLENAQYLWCAQKGNYDVSHLKKVVDQWIFTYPNKYLAGCTYPGTQALFETLRKNGIKIAIYSDYKAQDKLKAMGLAADLMVSSTDPYIDRLKPDPKGLLYIADQFKVAPQECLFIGDRPELDGECAIRANMPYLIVDKKPLNTFDFYTKLQHELTLSLKPKIYESGIYSS